jgi:hypothetical protein
MRHMNLGWLKKGREIETDVVFGQASPCPRGALAAGSLTEGGSDAISAASYVAENNAVTDHRGTDPHRSLAGASSFGKFVISRSAETYDASKSAAPVDYVTAVKDARKANVVLVVTNLEKAVRVC